jgi:hypothetical protein
MPTALQRTRACISEARKPLPRELATVASKILREAFPGTQTEANRVKADVLAMASLVGDRSRD